MKKFGIILLAAGESNRLGTPKQLLPYKGKTLVQHVLDEALDAGANQVVVVTGAVSLENSYVVHNENWKEGMASSIRIGLTGILKIDPSLDAVIFIVCDQPYLSSTLLKEIMETHITSGKDIVGSGYAGTVGIPALFAKSYFDALMKLNGDEGAKRIVMQNAGAVAVVDFPQGNIDIDTAADYDALEGKKE